MVVIITVVDAAIAETSVAFAKMLKSSLDYRKIESHSYFASQPQTILDLSSSEAVNSEFSKELHNEDATYHIDIRSIDTEELGSAIASQDFLIAHTNEATSQELNESVVNNLSRFSEATEIPITHLSMYPSIYAKLVLRVPTITIILNEDSVDLYRSAADELAETVEQTAPRSTN